MSVVHNNANVARCVWCEFLTRSLGLLRGCSEWKTAAVTGTTSFGMKVHREWTPGLEAEHREEGLFQEDNGAFAARLSLGGGEAGRSQQESSP